MKPKIESKMLTKDELCNILGPFYLTGQLEKGTMIYELACHIKAQQEEINRLKRETWDDHKNSR